MIRVKLLRFSFILAVLALSVLRGYGTGVIYASTAEEKAPLIKSNMLLESRGLIEPAVEIGNGGSFQYSFHKFKKFSGSTAFFSIKQKSNSRFTCCSSICITEFSAVPRYLFNRSILI